MTQARRNLGVINVVYTADPSDGNLYVLLGFNMKKQAWEVPGGKAEEGESMLEAAVRETEEETGWRVEPEPLSYVDTLDDYLVLTFDSHVSNEKVNYAECDNPEPDKYAQWAWFDENHLPLITWLSAEAIRHSLGVVVEDSKKLPCPFKKKTRVKSN
jgi:8-oxo-dGTP pyrophosphatase MutT (NUDIX family)